jgi:hypothetical protein
MNQPDYEWAGKIKKMLDHGAEGLDTRVVDRLAEARENALSRYGHEPARVLDWAAAPAGGRRPYAGNEQRTLRLRLVLLAAIVLSAVAIAVSWKSANTPPDIADIDASLLTDELPINAYLDKGFDAWVKRGSR